ncbi:MAG: DUF2157 domain-containing protein, partial [Halobacteriota archaeon]
DETGFDDRSRETIPPRRWAWLDRELDRWRADGVLTDDQAAAIRSRYESRPAEPTTDRSPDEAESTSAIDAVSRSRLVSVVSLMGAVLVAAGILVYLASNWEDIPRLGRAGILVASPTIGLAGGWWLWFRRAFPRVGHALWAIGTGLVGPSLFLLADLMEARIDPEWLLLAWALVAIPAGHLVVSQLTTVLALAVVAFFTVAFVDPGDPIVPLGLYGATLSALAGARFGPRAEPLRDAYRLVGAIALVGPLILFVGSWRRFGTYEFDTPAIAAVFVAATAIAVVASAIDRTEERRADRWVDTVAWPIVAVVGVGLAALLAVSVPDVLVDRTAFFIGHAIVLVVLVVTVFAGYTARSTTLVNAAIVLFVAQLFTFLLSTLVEGLSGPIALVSTGTVLLVIGYALERGRRTILERMATDRPG